MSINPIQGIQNYIIPVNRAIRIATNNRQIAQLESQITAHKEVASITKEMIANNTNTINLTKELIGAKKELIGAKKELIGAKKELIGAKKELIGAKNEMIANNTNSINIMKKIIGNNEKLIGHHIEHRGLLQESRDLTKESIGLCKQAEVCIEKMLAIMMKNPAKYGGLDKAQIQNLPEIIETKANMVKNIVEVKSKQYPKQGHVVLAETAKKLVDVSFRELNTENLPSVREMVLFFRNNVDMAFATRFSFEDGDYGMLPFKKYFTAQNIFFNFFKSKPQVDGKV